MIPLPVTHFLWQGGRRTRKILPRRLQNCGSLRAHVLPQRRRWFTSCASVKIEVQICPFSSAVQGRAPFSHTGDRPQIRAVIEARQIMQSFSLFTARSGRVRGYHCLWWVQGTSAVLPVVGTYPEMAATERIWENSPMFFIVYKIALTATALHFCVIMSLPTHRNWSVWRAELRF